MLHFRACTTSLPPAILLSKYIYHQLTESIDGLRVLFKFRVTIDHTQGLDHALDFAQIPDLIFDGGEHG